MPCQLGETPEKKSGTGGRVRTPGIRFWRPALYQLSYTRLAPTTGLEPTTFRSTGERSNRLSYAGRTWHGGRDRDRTCGIRFVRPALFQLSYPPKEFGTPNGIRTRVTGVKDRSLWPLEDRDMVNEKCQDGRIRTCDFRIPNPVL